MKEWNLSLIERSQQFRFIKCLTTAPVSSFLQMNSRTRVPVSWHVSALVVASVARHSRVTQIHWWPPSLPGWSRELLGKDSVPIPESGTLPPRKRVEVTWFSISRIHSWMAIWARVVSHSRLVYLGSSFVSWASRRRGALPVGDMRRVWVHLMSESQVIRRPDSVVLVTSIPGKVVSHRQSMVVHSDQGLRTGKSLG